MSPWLDMNDSDAHEKQVSWHDLKLLRLLTPYIRPHWKPLLASVLLLPLISLAQVAQPVIIKKAIDGPISQGNLSGLWELAAAFLVLLGVHYGLRYIQMYLAQVTGQRIILTLRTALYDHLQRLPMSFYHRTPIGKLVTRISSDVENVSEMFASGGLAIFSDFAIIIGILIAMGVMNLKLALLVYAMVPVIAITMEFFRRRSRHAYNEIRVQTAQLNIALQETLSGIDVIQILGREKQNRQSFEGHSRSLMQANLVSVIFDSAFTAAVEFLAISTILLVLAYIIWTSLPQAAAGVSFGVLVAFLQYIQMLFEPIEELSDKFTVIQSGLASVEKIMDLQTILPEVTSPASPRPLVNCQGHIRFEHVTFGYDPQRPVLQNVSFDILPGEKVAFIGATGAGKSTIIKLLSRHYDPQQGRILLDDVDIRDLALETLRQQIVVIPQDEFLFSRTIAENITLSYKTPIDEKRLVSVVNQVHANIVTDALPNGVQSALPERGRNLSNGERQLLVFARALWHNPQVLILDEATSSIDPHTEGLVQDALAHSLTGRTAIIIAHRLSTIEQVDRVYVLQDGHIAESGSPAALLKQSSLYRQFYDHYFRK